MIVPRSDFDLQGGKRGSEGVQKCQKIFFSGKIEPNRMLSGVGRSRPSRAEVEGVKIDPGSASGGPSGTKNCHL